MSLIFYISKIIIIFKNFAYRCLIKNFSPGIVDIALEYLFFNFTYRICIQISHFYLNFLVLFLNIT